MTAPMSAQPTDALKNMRDSYVCANCLNGLHDQHSATPCACTHPSHSLPVEPNVAHVHDWKVKWISGGMIGQECACGSERDLAASAAPAGETRVER